MVEKIASALQIEATELFTNHKKDKLSPSLKYPNRKALKFFTHRLFPLCPHKVKSKKALLEAPDETFPEDGPKIGDKNAKYR